MLFRTPSLRIPVEGSWALALQPSEGLAISAGFGAAFIGSSTIMNLRSKGFLARALITTLVVAWAVGIGLAAGRGGPGDRVCRR